MSKLMACNLSSLKNETNSIISLAKRLLGYSPELLTEQKSLDLCTSHSYKAQKIL